MKEVITENFSLLNEAVLKAVHGSTEKEIVKNFTDVIIHVLNADYGFSFFKDFNSEEFHLIYKDPRTPFDPPLPRALGVTQNAFKDKTPIYETDYTNSVWLINSLEPHIKGFVSIPISYQNNNYGTFNICYKELHQFTEEEKSLCVFIGNSAAQAITINRLVTSERVARIESENHQARFRALIENSYDIVGVVSIQGEIVYASPSVTRVTGYVLDELVGKNMRKFIHEEDLPTVLASLQATLQQPDAPQTIEFRYLHKDGSWRWLESTFVNMLNNPSVRNIVVNLHDITERKSAEETILHQALHDPLTDLPNRKEFVIRMDQALESAKRHKRQLALMFLDMDRFKNINDTLGHTVGDTLLKVVATRFKSCIRAEDTVARFGGDEFLILLNEIHSTEEAVIVAEKILRAVSIPVQIDQHIFHPSVSIGIAVYPYDGENTENLKKHADAALYHAKENGRNSYSLYDQTADIYAMGKFAMEQELREAFAAGQMTLHYQPILSLKNGRVLSVEALARWQHPTKGLLLPGEFIPLAEETGLILPLTDYIIREACKQYKIWEAADYPQFRIAINLSAQSFNDRGFVPRLANILDEYKVQPNILEIEITETMAMHNLELTGATLKQLRKMGVHITIDDFGTGYSSLSYLNQFPIHNLKIDRSFIRHCITNKQDASIARTIVAMAENLDLKVIAEGVETDQQLNFLASLGCNAAQGFYISQPVSGEELEIWMEQRKFKKKNPVEVAQTFILEKQ